MTIDSQAVGWQHINMGRSQRTCDFKFKVTWKSYRWCSAGASSPSPTVLLINLPAKTTQPPFEFAKYYMRIFGENNTQKKAIVHSHIRVYYTHMRLNVCTYIFICLFRHNFCSPLLNWRSLKTSRVLWRNGRNWGHVGGKLWNIFVIFKVFTAYWMLKFFFAIRPGARPQRHTNVWKMIMRYRWLSLGILLHTFCNCRRNFLSNSVNIRSMNKKVVSVGKVANSINMQRLFWDIAPHNSPRVTRSILSFSEKKSHILS